LPWVNATQGLRKLVTQPSRTINRKYHDPIELIGYVRVLVTVNNFDLFANDRKGLTPEDRDAIAARFLEVTPTAEAGRLLASVPREERDSIASADRLGRHALWLAETRDVASEGRFFVEGEAGGGFATRIVTEDGRFGSWVIEWLARYLSNPAAVEREAGALVWRGSGRAIVSPEAVVNSFTTLLKNKQNPQANDISNALRALSRGGQLVPFPGSPERAGFDILVEEVARWAADKGIGHPSRIRAAVRGDQTKNGSVLTFQAGAQ
jgi:hypothetical protein